MKYKIKNRKGLTIVGVLSVPENSIKGTAILQHWYGWIKEQKQIQIVQKALLDSWFQVFNFDATNSFWESDGKFEDARLGLHAEDFEDVAEWVKKQEWCEWKILVTGHSMWWFASARYASRFSTDIAIPLSPVIWGKYSFEAYKKYNPEVLEKWEKEGVLKRVSKTFPWVMRKQPWEFMTEKLNHDLLIEKPITIPTLVVNWDADTTCPYEYAQVFFETVKNKQKKIVICSWVGHNFLSEKEQRLLYQSIVEFLSELS